MEKIRGVIIIFAIVSVYIFISTVAFGKDYLKYDLLLSLELSREVIYQYEPVQVRITLENGGTSPLSVLPLRIVNMETNVEASLILELIYPNGKELNTILLEPHYGPISLIEYGSVEETTIMPVMKKEIFFYLSDSWGCKEKKGTLIFDVRELCLEIQVLSFC